MSEHLIPQLLGRIAVVALVALAATVAVIHSRRSEDAGVIAPLKRKEADALAAELARCRAVTPSETTSLENCRQIWAEKRRQFFRPAKPSTSLTVPITPTTNGAEKSQDRLPSSEVR